MDKFERVNRHRPRRDLDRFPFARQIIADNVRNGGFPPLFIDPIDFVALYRQRMADMQSANAVPN